MAGSSRSHRFWVPTPLPCPPPTLHATMIPGRLLRTSGCDGTTGCCPSIFHRLRKASNNISPEPSPAQQSWADGGSNMAMECYGCYGYGMVSSFIIGYLSIPMVMDVMGMVIIGIDPALSVQLRFTAAFLLHERVHRRSHVHG